MVAAEQAKPKRRSFQYNRKMNTRVINNFTAAICICISFAALDVASTEQAQQGFIRTTKTILLGGFVNSENELNMDSLTMLQQEDQELNMDPLTMLQLEDQEFWERSLSTASTGCNLGISTKKKAPSASFYLGINFGVLIVSVSLAVFGVLN